MEGGAERSPKNFFYFFLAYLAKFLYLCSEFHLYWLKMRIYLQKMRKGLYILILLLGGMLTVMPMHAEETNYTVVLDAGHGGKDPGAVNGDIYEKDIALQIALKLNNTLKKDFQYKRRCSPLRISPFAIVWY